MKLVIVESPNKCETIKKYLGNDYKVDASIGHIRDLATSGKGGLGVDVENNFKPTYKISDDKQNVVAKLKKDVKAAEEVYLATDPDREGEAISWHLAEVLKLDVGTTKRLEFHEITKKAILKAIANPRVIDMDLVSSQEARRIIDRIMGFKLSKLLQNRIKSESAGRVQSVTLRLITDRQKERDAFKSETYYTVEGLFDHRFKATLTSYQGNKVEIKTLEDAQRIIQEAGNDFISQNYQTKEKLTYPKAPFKTSTLQIEGGRKYKMSASQVQRNAQKLFESGLITYIRTEGETMAEDFIRDGIAYVDNNYGHEYLSSTAHLTQMTNRQDSAHEAIRPTSLDLTPDKAKEEYHLDTYASRLYKLIYNRTLASLMGPKKEMITTLEFASHGYIFKYQVSKIIFDGFTKVYFDEEEENVVLPEENKHYEGVLNAKEHETEPPTLYNEARLVKAMEDEGIGRPSTYASTIETLYKRKYIENDKDKNILPTEQGILTSDILQKYFPPFMEVSYTSSMEKNLDEIKADDGSEVKILKDFYNEFTPFYDNAMTNMEKVKKEVEYTGNICPKCGKPLVKRKSRFGEFEACSNYPECKYVTKQEKAPVEFFEGKMCPECGKPLVKRKSRKGEFVACSGFPNCHYILGNENAPKKEKGELTNIPCPKCGKTLIRRKGVNGKPDFYGCSNFPRCRYSRSINEDE